MIRAGAFAKSPSDACGEGVDKVLVVMQVDFSKHGIFDDYHRVQGWCKDGESDGEGLESCPACWKDNLDFTLVSTNATCAIAQSSRLPMMLTAHSRETG
jgi:hypothetical protein